MRSHLIEGFRDGKSTPIWDFGELAAAGSLKSATFDLVKFMEANLYPKGKLEKAILDIQRVPQKGNIAFGWVTYEKNGNRYYWHNGSTYGASSFLGINFTKKTGVAILSNSTHNYTSDNRITNCGHQILEELK